MKKDTKGRIQVDGLRICVIGGGSTYTPELVEGVIANAHDLLINTLVLMDIDSSRLNVVGGLAQRMLDASDSHVTLVLTTDRQQALCDADYIITQIRVGGVEARIRDEKIPLKYDVIGQETTGPGGFAKALRTIPVMLDIVAEMEQLAPKARLINFTNPSGLITQAICDHTNIRAIGLCNSPLGMLRSIARLLDVLPEKIWLDFIGLNHLCWARGVYLDGQDITDQVIERVISENLMPMFTPQLLRALRMLPSYYLDYYYNTDRVLHEQKTASQTRGEVVRTLEQDLLRAYEDPTLSHKPETLSQRGGAHYSAAALSLIRSLEMDAGDLYVVNCPNHGTFPSLPNNAVIEIACTINKNGATPRACQPLPVSIRGLVQSVKAYEELTIQAGVSGDETAAILALTAHPLVPSFDVAQQLWAEIKEVNAEWLPQFTRA